MVNLYRGCSIKPDNKFGSFSIVFNPDFCYEIRETGAYGYMTAFTGMLQTILYNIEKSHS